ncbi:uncharacterized protein O3C94_007213 [Discoglossus pictus]
MAQVLGVKCRTPFESLLFRTAFSLAFFGAFRIGELVASSRHGSGGLQVVLGIKKSEFGTHSFRIGAATEAARLGLHDAAVKRIGRWESERFQSYVRPRAVI